MTADYHGVHPIDREAVPSASCLLQALITAYRFQTLT